MAVQSKDLYFLLSKGIWKGYSMYIRRWLIIVKFGMNVPWKKPRQKGALDFLFTFHSRMMDLYFRTGTEIIIDCFQLLYDSQNGWSYQHFNEWAKTIKIFFTFGLKKFVVSAIINLPISDRRAHGRCAPAEMMC